MYKSKKAQFALGALVGIYLVWYGIDVRLGTIRMWINPLKDIFY